MSATWTDQARQAARDARRKKADAKRARKKRLGKARRLAEAVRDRI